MCSQKYFVRYYFDVNEGKRVDAEFNLRITQSGTVVLKEDYLKMALVGNVNKAYYVTSVVNPNQKFECVITMTKWVTTDNSKPKSVYISSASSDTSNSDS